MIFLLSIAKPFDALPYIAIQSVMVTLRNLQLLLYWGCKILSVKIYLSTIGINYTQVLAYFFQ